MKSFVNLVARWLLQSPFHSLLSKHALLITVTGRKSGKMYTTPIDYVQVNNQIVVVSTQTHSWWKNARGGASVQVALTGKDVDAKAHADTRKPLLSQC